jgi:50S ribosomal subunit-associated GTPase HflX
VVANQIDRCDGQALERARRLAPPPLFVSATHGDGLAHLTRRLREACRNPAPTVRS